MKAAVIVQARVHSSRLDQKIFYEVGGWPLLRHVLWRCSLISEGVDVVCASPETDPAERFLPICEAVGARFVQGPLHDVLARYLLAARSGGYSVVVRVTSDCPLIDPAVCRSVLKPVLSGTVDYSCNNNPPSFPHGLDCEAFTTRALETAAALATSDHDREHVTPFLRRCTRLRLANVVSPDPRWKDVRVTLDYPEDLELLRAIDAVRSLRTITGLGDIAKLIEDNSGLLEINANRRLER